MEMVGTRTVQRKGILVKDESPVYRQAIKTIGIDFDGTIHGYRAGWQDGTVYDTPISGSIEALTKLVDAGYHIAVISTRASDDDQVSRMATWLEVHLFNYLERRGYEPPATWNMVRNIMSSIQITDRKVAALAYIDDRAIRFEDNWDSIIKLYT